MSILRKVLNHDLLKRFLPDCKVETCKRLHDGTLYKNIYSARSEDGYDNLLTLFETRLTQELSPLQQPKFKGLIGTYQGMLEKLKKEHQKALEKKKKLTTSTTLNDNKTKTLKTENNSKTKKECDCKSCLKKRELKSQLPKDKTNKKRSSNNLASVGANNDDGNSNNKKHKTESKIINVDKPNDTIKVDKTEIETEFESETESSSDDDDYSYDTNKYQTTLGKLKPIDKTTAKSIQEVIKQAIYQNDVNNKWKYLEHNYQYKGLKYSVFKSTIVTTKWYDYLLTPCPQDILETSDLIHHCLNQDIHLMVSAVKYKEKFNTARTDFWSSQILEHVPLRYGWMLTDSIDYYSKEDEFLWNLVRSQVVEQCLKYDDKIVAIVYEYLGLNCSIQDRLYKFRKFQFESQQHKESITLPFQDISTGVLNPVYEIHHLHCYNWPDAQPYPDEAILYQLLEKIEDLSKGKMFQVNCLHGRGRSGTILTCHLLRQIVRAVISGDRKENDDDDNDVNPNADKELNDVKHDPIVVAADNIVEQVEKNELTTIKTRLNNAKINIPKLIYNLRLQRRDFVKHHGQLYNIYNLTIKFCDWIIFIEGVLIKLGLQELIKNMIISYL